MVVCRQRPRLISLLLTGWIATLTCAGWARSPMGPGAGSGARRAPAAASTPESKAKETTEQKPKSHKTGRVPKSPSPRLPDDAARQPEDLAARRAIAGQSTSRTNALSDPELNALREADRIMFPRALAGFRSGWSWDDADPSVQQQGLPPVVQALPSAADEDAALSEWLRSLALPDFPVRFDARVVKYLKFYRDTKSGRAIAEAWVKKVGRYGPAMQAELSKAGLPKDIVWLSVIESGHDPTALSPAGAAGMWQFIPESGRMYGLTVDRWVDERLDPARSTQAAAAYLGDLAQRFGSWELAMAAYNMGHGGMLRAVRKYNSNDFWKLSRWEAGLPWETSLYVPKVFALAIVMNNKRAFGLDSVKPEAPVSFDTVYVEPGVALEDVAKASGIPIESLRSMNPQYLSDRTPPGAPETSAPERSGSAWPVRVPVGSGRKTAGVLSQGKHGGQYKTTVVRFGDTLESVAARIRTSERALAVLNGVRANERLEPGAVLLVPAVADAGGADGAGDDEIVVVPERDAMLPGRKRIFYRVVGGDTVESIATALGISALELVAWNRLDPNAKLQSEMTLLAFVPRGRDLDHVRHVTDQSSRVLEAGSEAFVQYFEGLNGRKRIVVSAKQGESLAGIGKRFGLSVGMMERINRFPRTQKLTAGEPIIVYVKHGDSDASMSAKPLARVEAPRPDVLPDAD